MIIGCVCCRKDSQRISNKALQKVGGKTLVDRAIGQAMDIFEYVIVCTDIPEVLDRDYPVVMEEQPPEFAREGRNKWGLFRYLVNKHPCDILVDLDIGCPFRSRNDVINTIQRLDASDLAITAYESERNPYFNMVEYYYDSYRVVNKLASPVTCSAQAPKVYSLSPAVYAMRSWAVNRFDHWSQVLFDINVIPRERGWDIDTPFDLTVARMLAERNE